MFTMETRLGEGLGLQGMTADTIRCANSLSVSWFSKMPSSQTTFKLVVKLDVGFPKGEGIAVSRLQRGCVLRKVRQKRYRNFLCEDF